jgi:hypothetical protein
MHTRMGSIEQPNACMSHTRRLFIRVCFFRLLTKPLHFYLLANIFLVCVPSPMRRCRSLDPPVRLSLLFLAPGKVDMPPHLPTSPSQPLFQLFFPNQYAQNKNTQQQARICLPIAVVGMTGLVCSESVCTMLMRAPALAHARSRLFPWSAYGRSRSPCKPDLHRALPRGLHLICSARGQQHRG